MKHVLVTGGSRGLGLAMCQRLLEDGWRVTTTSRRVSSELERLRSEYEDRLRHVAVDLSQPGAATELARQAGVLGGFDGFVANAAVGTEGLLTLTAEAALRECVEVNLISNMILAREVIKGMLSRKRGGSLVFVSSVAARTGFAGLSVYAATKGALTAFSRAIAREYGERGIRSNCLLPGFFETEMSASLADDQRDRIRRRTALKRLGDAKDIVGAAAFLLSEEGRYVTGAELVVDGGLSA